MLTRDRLDKDLFEDGLLMLQRRVEERYYAKAIPFVQDLGEVIHEGIITTPGPAQSAEGRVENPDAPAPKNPFADIRERRKLGKRILKAVQPQLETALRIESEISSRPFEALQRDLEARIEASLDTQQAITVGSNENEGLDSIMVDASDPSEIRVQTANQQEGSESVNDDPMDLELATSGNIEVNTTGLGIVDGDTGDVDMTDEGDLKTHLTNGAVVSQTPPNSNGEDTTPRQGTHNGPPSPPQSNGSLGKPLDPLADGGVLWYLKAYQLQGTSILEERWTAGRDAMRMLSEDLTDLDDEELKGLGVDVNGTVTAAEEDGDEPAEPITSPVKTRASKAAAAAAATAATSPKKRRTSARRR